MNNNILAKYFIMLTYKPTSFMDYLSLILMIIISKPEVTTNDNANVKIIMIRTDPHDHISKPKAHTFYT